MSLTPVTFIWQGGAMRPVVDSIILDQYEEGRKYRLVEYEPRSRESHSHYFAVIGDAWRNLPDDLADQIPSAEHLRKWCLIRTGYCIQRHINFTTDEDAKAAAGVIRTMDDFAVVAVRESTVSIYTAESQSTAAMGKDRFQASKQAVLDKIAEILGVPSADLQAQAGRAA